LEHPLELVPPYRLSLIPPWRLDGPPGDLDIPSRKARALLCCLALANGQSLTREGLAALLWSESDSHKARSSLRQTLAGLRRVLVAPAQPLLHSSNDRIGLAPGALGTDLEQGLAAIAQGRPDAIEVMRLSGAVDLMADLHGLDPELDSWIGRQRALWLAQILRQLRALFDDATRPADTRRHAAQLALSIDDLDEDALRCLMQINADEGKAVAALRLYGAFYDRLQAEMDAEPSVQTQDLAVRIKLMDPQVPGGAEGPAGPGRGAAGLPAVIAAPPVKVAVLPFEVLGNTGLPDFVRIGLLDQITCRLAAYRAPSVISSNSTRRYLQQTPDMAQVARDLGATYVVSGSVMVNRCDCAVNVQLIESAGARVAWAGVFRRPVELLFDLRGDIADAVAGIIMPTVDLAELRRAHEAPVGQLAPYHLVLRAKELIFRLDRGAFDDAGDLLRQAVAQDPLFAPGQALMAEWHALRHWQGWGSTPDDDRDGVRRHVSRAIALSPGDGRAKSLWGHCRMLFDRDYSGALSLFDSALNLHPNDSETLIWSAPTLAYTGNADMAVAHARRAIELSPLDPFQFRNEHFLSLALYCQGTFDEAADLGLSSYARAPDLSSNLRMTIAALVAANRRDEAAPLVARHRQMLPRFSVAEFLPMHRLSKSADRQVFGERLVAAGLPAQPITQHSH